MRFFGWRPARDPANFDRDNSFRRGEIIICFTKDNGVIFILLEEPAGFPRCWFSGNGIRRIGF